MRCSSRTPELTRFYSNGVWFGVAALLLALVYEWWALQYGASGALAWMNGMSLEVAGFWFCCGLLVINFSLSSTSIAPALLRFLPWLVLVGGVVLAWSGLKQHIHTGERITLKLGYPVPAGFILAMLILLAGIVTTHWQNLRMRIGYLVVLGAITAMLVTFTGTRDALFVLLILAIGIILELKKRASTYAINPRVYMVVVLLIIILLGAAFHHRFDQLWSDLDAFYHGVPSGSMGGRFEIWQAGIHSFLLNPWGYDGNLRFMEVRDFLKQHLIAHENLVGSIMWAAKHHMHDEVIEAMSLQGMLGLVALIFFYVTFYRASDRANMHYMGRWLLLAIVVFGLTEPILNSNKTVLCLGFIIPLCLAYSHDPKR